MGFFWTVYELFFRFYFLFVAQVVLFNHRTRSFARRAPFLCRLRQRKHSGMSFYTQLLSNHFELQALAHDTKTSVYVRQSLGGWRRPVGYKETFAPKQSVRHQDKHAIKKYTMDCDFSL